MGIALSVDGKTCASWAYSGFNKFRERVANEIGIDLKKMEGFHDVDRSVLEVQGWEAYRDAMIEAAKKPQISWEGIADPIVHLLHHSDCEGEIASEHCATLADRLEEIIKNWPDTVNFKTDAYWQEKGYAPEMTMEDYDIVQARGLIDGLRVAAATGKPLEFH